MGAVSLALSITGLVFAPSAAADQDDCPEEYLCVWDNATYSGSPTWKSMTDLYDLSSTSGFSVVNNTSMDVRFKIISHYGPPEPWVIACLHAPPGANAHAWRGGFRRTLSWTQIGVIC
ncbi:peptidase inhibitor family I36 protein [Streptomyces sp. NPDC055078]